MKFFYLIIAKQESVVKPHHIRFNHKMLEVQQYLLTHSLQQLELEHGVNHRFSADKTKFSLNYDQLAAKSNDPIANQCRGLILRPRVTEHLTTSVVAPNEVVGPTEVVARPMDRFFNAGDPAAAAIDWSTARIQCKLDGTCCILYYDFAKAEWCVATRSVPEADVSFGDIVSPLKENTFYNLFRYSVCETIRAQYREFYSDTSWDEFTSMLDRNVTYVYELTSPVNRIVVKYDNYRVTLLAARETANGKYLPLEEGYGPGLQVVEEWPLKTLADIEAFLRDSDPAKIEGAVVIDASHNRIKVKSAQWILASRAKDMVSMSKRNALTCIIDGSSDDVIPLLSEELQEYMHKLQSSLVGFCKQIDEKFTSFKATANGNRKEFALMVQASGLWQTPFFNLLGGKWATTIEWLRHLSVEKKLTDSTLDVILEAVR